MSTPPYSQQSHSIHQPPNPQTDKLCEHTPTNKDNTPASHSILRSERLQPIQQTPNPHQQTDIYEHNTPTDNRDNIPASHSILRNEKVADLLPPSHDIILTPEITKNSLKEEPMKGKPPPLDSPAPTLTVNTHESETRTSQKGKTQTNSLGEYNETKIGENELQEIIHESINQNRFIDDENDLLSVNNMKFPKPRIKRVNDFKSENIVDDLDRLHQICRQIDQHEYTNKEKQFYENAISFVNNTGRTKLNDRNKRANRKKMILEHSLTNKEEQPLDINSINLETGRFRTVKCIIGTKKQIKTHCLIDSGASHTLINRKLIREIDCIEYENVKMTMNSAGCQNDTENVVAKAKIKLTLRDIHGDYKYFVAKVLVLENTNDHNIIIGADILFNKNDTTLSNKHWTIKNHQTGVTTKISLKAVKLNTPTNIDRIQSTDRDIHKKLIEINSTHQDIYEKEFENFVNNPPKHTRNASDKDKSQTDKNYSESIKELHKTHKDFVLPDNFCENELPNWSQTIIENKYIDETYTLEDIKLDHIPEKHRKQLKDLCKKYEDIFAKNNFDMGTTSLIKHTIDIGEKEPKSQTKRFTSSEKEEFAIKACRKLEKNNIIAESNIPRCVSNLVLIPKYDNVRDNTKASKMHQTKNSIDKYRLAQDFRILNECTINVNRTNAINVDAFIQKIKGKIVSQLDLCQAFFAIPLEKDSQELTAFYLGNKKYRWLKMSQGLIGAPATFEKLMQETFSDELMKDIQQNTEFKIKPTSFNDILNRYVDDVFSHSDTYETQLEALELIFIALRRANLKLSPKKCIFLATEIKVLGYSLNTEKTEIFLDINKAKGIIAWDTPSSLYELQSRLFSIAYFNKFLPNIKRVIYPLLHLLRQKEFKWEQIHQDAWENLKLIIKMDIRLTIPHSDEQLYLFTDASSLACAQILFVERDNTLKVVSCNSKLFNYLDSRKNIFTREGLSLVIGIQKFRQYLDSSNKTPIILTDCSSLLYNGRLKEFNIASAQISNYLAKTAQEMKFQVYHISGKLNFLADLFSRSYLNSRLIGRPALSKKQAEIIPDIPKDFSVSSDALYQFLASPLIAEGPICNKKRRTNCERPTQSFIKMLKQSKPEERAIADLKIKIGNNAAAKQNLTHQISKKENTKLNKANQIMINHYEIDTDPPSPHDDETDKRATHTYETSNSNGDLTNSHNNKLTNVFIDKRIFKDGEIKNPKIIMLGKNQTKELCSNAILYADKPFEIKNCLENIQIICRPTKQAHKTSIYIKNTTNNDTSIPYETKLCEILTKNDINYISAQNNNFSPTEYYQPNSLTKITGNIKIEGEDTHENEIAKQNTEPNNKNELFENSDKNLTTNLAEIVQDSNKLQQYILEQNKNLLNDHTDDYIQNIKILQEYDTFCNKIIRNWPANTVKLDYPYEIINEILYRKHEKKKLLVVPKVLLKPLIFQLHQNLCHPSKTLLYQHMKLYYFCPNMTKMIKITEEKCFTCMTIRPSIKNTKKTGNERTFQPQKPREAWSADLITGLPKSKNNKTAYILLTCIASRYCTAYPLKDKGAYEIESALQQHFLNFGTPKFLFSDSDISLIKAIKELQMKFLFHYETSPPSQQQANIVENSYKTLKTLITRQIYDEKNELTRQNWDTALTLTIQAYNKLPLKGLNYTKEEIFFRFPLNTTLYALHQNSATDEDVSTEIKQYMNNKIKTNELINAPKYQKGQIIYIKNDLKPPTGVKSQYLQGHRGPLVITQNHHQQRYVIAREISTLKYFSVAHDRIILIERAYEIPLLLNKVTEKKLYTLIKHANTDNHEPQVKLDKHLNEIPNNIQSTEINKTS